MATTGLSTPYITLTWQAGANITGQTLWRRVKGSTAWESPVTLNPGDTSYADASASPGIAYEYSIQRAQSVAPTTVYGSIVAGCNIPLVEQRGKVILLVDQSMSATLDPDLTQLQQDLAGDGWTVIRHDVPRQVVPASSTTTSDFPIRFNEQKSIRDLVKADYATDPSANWALFIIGHIPVPYSGYFAPDGHGGHVGAWPTDAYYADVAGTWTDNTVAMSATPTDVRNLNVVGDGKFDQSSIPADAQLIQCGRVDLSNMSQVPSGMSEVKLLRQYLVRDHRFRKGVAPYDAVQRRAMIDDNFGYLGGEAFASSGWRTGIGFFGRNPGQVDALDWFGTLQTTPMLLAYGCGSGDWGAAAGVGTSISDFAWTDSKAVFCMLFGSWFGDWDCTNDFLRAPLAGTADSLGLADVWSGRPYDHLFHMALGENIGYSVRFTQTYNGNTASGDWMSDSGERYVHINLMGDPTLRLHTVKPPTNVSAASGAGGVALTWTASVDSVSGYHIYRASSPAGPYTRLTGATATTGDPMGSPIVGTSYTDTTAVANTTYTYMVRAVKMESSPSGTYANQSVGAPVTVTQLPVASLVLAPDGLSATGTANATYLLTWQDHATNATSYQVERRDPSTLAWSVIATLGANATTYTDSSAPTGDVVYYRVRAIGSSSNSDYSNIADDPNLTGLIRFSTSFLLLNKGDGAVPVSAIRYSGSQGTATLSYLVTNVLGTSGIDYTASSGTLTWAHGDVTNKSLTVNVLSPSGPQLTKLLRVYTTANASQTILQIQDAASQTLPSPWLSQAFGSVLQTGYAEQVNGTFGLNARTDALGVGGADSCRFLYQPVDGDCQILARITFLSSAITPDMSAGVMLRGAVTTGSQMASILLSSSGLAATCRASDSANTTSTTQSGITPPYWMRVERAGTTVNVSYSIDGSTWTQLGATQTLGGLGTTAYVGFAMGSNSYYTQNDLRGYAQFDNVKVFTSTPSAPSTLTASNNGNAGEIGVSWSFSTGAQYYLIERSTTSGSGYAQIAQVDGSATGYTDTGLTANQTYYYRVRVSNPYGQSGYTTTASTTPSIPATLDGWRYANFGTTQNSGNAADLAAPMGDGVANVMKYTMGLSASTPISSSVIGLQLQSFSGTNYLTCAFARLVSATDVFVTVEAANSLAGPWTSIDPTLAANQVSVQNDTPRIGVQTITVKDTQPQSSSSTRFMRLRVTRP